MTTPKLKFSHAELTEAGFVLNKHWRADHYYEHRDGRCVYADSGLDGVSSGFFYVDSLDQLTRPGEPLIAQLATANATIARLTEERDKLLFCCELFSEAWHTATSNFDGITVVSSDRLESAIDETDKAIAEVKGGAK